MEGGPKIEDYLRIVRWRPCENQGAPNLKGYTRRNSGRDLIICRSRGYGLPLSSLLSPFFGYVTPPHIVNLAHHASCVRAIFAFLSGSSWVSMDAWMKRVDENGVRCSGSRPGMANDRQLKKDLQGPVVL